jgi:hypothetical protein
MQEQREETILCNCPPALDELALIAAIDGEADEATRQHLRKCPYCASRAQTFDQLQRALRQRLFRIFCPSSEDLAAYQQGWLDAEKRAIVKQHLLKCPLCAQEQQILHQVARQPLTEAPSRPLRRVVAVPVSPMMYSKLSSVYGGARARGPSEHYAYRAENLEVTIDVQRAAGQPNQLAVVGMLLHDEGMVGGLRPATASLLAENQVISSAQLDELGSFVLEDVSPGDYVLSLRLPDLEVVIEALEL